MSLPVKVVAIPEEDGTVVNVSWSVECRCADGHVIKVHIQEFCALGFS